MAQFALDEVSAASLPKLDSLIQADEKDKVFALVDKTSGPALTRLTLAAVSRHRVLPASMPRQQAAHFLENAILANINYRAENHIELIRTKLSEDAKRSILKLSLIRFNMVDRPQFEGIHD